MYIIDFNKIYIINIINNKHQIIIMGYYYYNFNYYDFHVYVYDFDLKDQTRCFIFAITTNR